MLNRGHAKIENGNISDGSRTWYRAVASSELWQISGCVVVMSCSPIRC